MLVDYPLPFLAFALKASVRVDANRVLVASRESLRALVDVDAADAGATDESAWARADVSSVLVSAFCPRRARTWRAAVWRVAADAVLDEIGGTGAVVAAAEVDADSVRAAGVRARRALVDVGAREAVAGEAGRTGALVIADCIGAFGSGVAAVASVFAFVDV